MHFDLIQSLSLCGTLSIPNDDRTGTNARRAWVIDGATDLAPPGLLGAQGGAAWLAATADSAFATADADRLADVCAQVAATIETRYHAERRREPAGPWEWPRASFAAVQIAGDLLELAWASDCSILHATAVTVTWRTPPPNRTRESAPAAALGPGVGAARLSTPPILEDRRAARSRPGQRVLGIDAGETMAILNLTQFDVSIGDELLLMTDGMVALVDSYGVHDGHSLFAAVRANGLAALGTELRAIENDDAACLRYPRFKVSDDATCGSAADRLVPRSILLDEPAPGERRTALVDDLSEAPRQPCLRSRKVAAIDRDACDRPQLAIVRADMRHREHTDDEYRTAKPRNL